MTLPKVTAKWSLMALGAAFVVAATALSISRVVTGDPVIGLPFLSSTGPAQSVFDHRIQQIKPPGSCHVFSSQYYSHGTDAPSEYYNLQFGCSSVTAGQLQDAMKAQMAASGYHEVADTAPNPDQVLRMSFEDSKVRLDWSVGTPNLATRNPAIKVPQSTQRQEPASGVNMILSQLK